MNEIEVVKLNKQEQALFESICWDLHELSRKQYETRIEHLKSVGQLAEQLLRRGAIPQIRRNYFTKPEMNIGGHGKSRKKEFERNGISGKAILRNLHFFDYLRYFISGPDLLKDTIQGFCKIIEEDRGTSGMVLNQIRAYVRKEIRNKGLSPGHAAEEFFKLAHEINRPDLAESVRSAAKTVRK